MCARSFAIVLTAVWGMSAAQAGSLVASPITTDFGSRSVSSGAALDLVSVTNQGTNTQVTGFSLGAGCAEFTAAAAIPLPATLGNGDSLAVNVSYDPANRGPDQCQVTPQSDGTGGDFTLEGTGIAPQLHTTPTMLQFADQRWNGGTPQNLNITITNNGEEMIAAENLSVTLATGAHFSTGAAIGLPIASGESALIPVTFDPGSAGAKSDTVTLSIDNDPPSDPNDTVNLSGTGTQSVQTFSPTSLDIGTFDVGAGGAAIMLIGNAGNATLNIGSISITGPHALDFSFQDHGCTGQGPCTPVPGQIGAKLPEEPFSIRCEPSEEGLRTASLNLSSDDPDSPRTATLLCTGLDLADVMLIDGFEY